MALISAALPAQSLPLQILHGLVVIAFDVIIVAVVVIAVVAAMAVVLIVVAVATATADLLTNYPANLVTC